VRYDVTFGVDGEGAPVAVELVEKPDGRVEATVDGREVAIDVAPIEALGLSSVLVDAQVVDLALEAGGLDEVVVFASVLEKTAAAWAENACVIVDGRVSHRDSETKLLCENAKKLE